MSVYEFDSKLGVFSLRKSDTAEQVEARQVQPVISDENQLELLGEELVLNFAAVEEPEPEEIGASVLITEENSTIDSGISGKRNNDNFKGYEEDYASAINKEKVRLIQNLEKFTDRKWSSNSEKLSLYDIVNNIISRYDSGFRALKIPEEWKEEEFTIKDPLVQDESDFAFLVEICKSRGYRMRRTNGGREFEFIPEAEGRKQESQYNAKYRIVVHSYGADIEELDFLDKDETDEPVFIIKNEFNVNMTTNGSFMPNIRQYVDDEGNSRVVVETPDLNDSFLSDEFIFLTKELKKHFEQNRAGTLSKKEQEFFNRFVKNRATFEEIKENYYRVKRPDLNSNDRDENGYSIFRYEGWEASFTTHGNPWAVVGDWLTIEGASSNLYFPFQIKGLVHRFSHKWETDYTMIR